MWQNVMGKDIQDFVKREIEVMNQAVHAAGEGEWRWVVGMVGPWAWSQEAVFLFNHLVRTILKNGSNCFHILKKKIKSYLYYVLLSFY